MNEKLSSSLRRTCFIAATLVSVGASAAAEEVPPVCAQVAQLANHGRLDETVDAKACIDLDGAGQVQCVQVESSGADMGALYLEGPDGRYTPFEVASVDRKRHDAIARGAQRQVIRLESTYYVLDSSADGPIFLSTLNADATLGIRCEFERRDGFVTALTRYERLVRAAEGTDLWATALTADGTGDVDLLLANGHDVPETIESLPALSWAISQERAGAIEWLLKHGARVNVGRTSDMPLVRAVTVGNGALAVRLLELGADPLPLLEQLRKTGQLQPEHESVLIMAALRRLGSIPERVVIHALHNNPTLLDALTRSRFKVRLASRDWHAGRRLRVPIAVAAAASGWPHLPAKVDRIFRSGTLPPADRTAWLSYGAMEHGLLVTRRHDGNLSDKEMLKYATAICIYFVDTDQCGPPSLQRAAREWAAQLDYCVEVAGEGMPAAACNVLMRYAHRKPHTYRDDLLIYRWDRWTLISGAGASNVQTEELRRMYAAKELGRKGRRPASLNLPHP